TGNLSAHIRAATDPWAGAYPPAARRLARYKSGPLPVLGFEPKELGSRADRLRERAAEVADLLQGFPDTPRCAAAGRAAAETLALRAALAELAHAAGRFLHEVLLIAVVEAEV